MSRRQKVARRSAVIRRWFTVRRGLRCLTGHWIAVGEPALHRRVAYLTSVLCARCAKEQLGLEPPGPKSFEPGDVVGDFKVAQAGDGTERTSE